MQEPISQEVNKCTYLFSINDTTHTFTILFYPQTLFTQKCYQLLLFPNPQISPKSSNFTYETIEIFNFLPRNSQVFLCLFTNRLRNLLILLMRPLKSPRPQLFTQKFTSPLMFWLQIDYKCHNSNNNTHAYMYT